MGTGANAARIPCVMMNEHRDAYCCWTYFANEGFIGESGNYLLHVDHHDDYEIGLYERDLTRMPRTFDEALDFTDKELGIADFIVPALWQGMFSALHNLKTILPASFKDRTHLLLLRDGNVLEMRRTMTPLLEERAKADPERYRIYAYREGGLHRAARIDAASIVLDIDLDYFCWDNSLLSVPEKRVEITKEAYEDYLADRYHPLRLLSARTVKPRVVGGEGLPGLPGGGAQRPAPKRRADSEADRQAHRLPGRSGCFAEGHRRLPLLHLGLPACREGGIRRGELHEAPRRAVSAANDRAARHLRLTQKRLLSR